MSARRAGVTLGLQGTHCHHSLRTPSAFPGPATQLRRQAAQTTLSLPSEVAECPNEPEAVVVARSDTDSMRSQ